jgi:hypothetical protein
MRFRIFKAKTLKLTFYIKNSIIYIEKIKRRNLTMNDLRKVEKKIKGYGYDSLCLRYKIAREAQARYEAYNLYDGDVERSMRIAQHDVLKFYQILDDLIGEHY